MHKRWKRKLRRATAQPLAHTHTHTARGKGQKGDKKPSHSIWSSPRPLFSSPCCCCCFWNKSKRNCKRQVNLTSSITGSHFMTQWTVYNVQWTMPAAYAYLQYGKNWRRRRRRLRWAGREGERDADLPRLHSLAETFFKINTIPQQNKLNKKNLCAAHRIKVQ